jgi:hypothetical protein
MLSVSESTNDRDWLSWPHTNLILSVRFKPVQTTCHHITESAYVRTQPPLTWCPYLTSA